MQKLLFFSILTFILIGCSDKPKTKSGFKLVLGHAALETSSVGGAFVQTTDLGTQSKSLYKLDSENSAMIPHGTYTISAVIFSGPDVASGVMKCGSVSNINLASPEATVTINLLEENCQQTMYATMILETKKNTTAKWNSDRWNLSYWGQ